MAINYPDDAHFPEQYSTLGESTIVLKADVGDVDQIRTMFANWPRHLAGSTSWSTMPGSFRERRRWTLTKPPGIASTT